MFRYLSLEEEAEFRQWARENWEVGEEIDILWHPIVRDECKIILEENNVD